MIALSPRHCANCRFWDNEVPTLATGTRRPLGSTLELGTCHARSPEVARSAGFVMPLFPETHATRFCGLWEQGFDESGGGSDGGGGEEADAKGEADDGNANVLPFAKTAP